MRTVFVDSNSLRQFSASGTKSAAVSARARNFTPTCSQQQQPPNLSVLRFTLGIPGLDESYLPRWIGYGFGSLIVVNHFYGYSPAPAQLRTEALGLSLAAFSITLPYLGRFLKGASRTEQATLPEGVEQVFVMSGDLHEATKEDLAWATYVLLRNTKAISVLIAASGKLCARGYWNIPGNVSKEDLAHWFSSQIEVLGISELEDSLYYLKPAESGFWDIVPRGTRSLLVEPIVQVTDQSGGNEAKMTEGFILLASSLDYAYSDKDQAWIRAVANKFGGILTGGEPA